MLKRHTRDGQRVSSPQARPLLRLVHGGDSPRRQAPLAQSETVDLGNLIIGLIKQCGTELAAIRQRVPHTLSLGARLVCGLQVPRETASCLEFVIREIIANAYRHAHPDGEPVQVTVSSAQANKGDILIEIGDDGVGLPRGFAEWRDAGNGIVSIRAHLQKINAVLNVTSDDLGLRFQILLCGSAYAEQGVKPARDSFVWL